MCGSFWSRTEGKRFKGEGKREKGVGKNEQCGDCCMKYFIEQQIIDAVRKLLTGKVNELLGDIEFSVPLVEFSDYKGGTAVVPVISLASCERTEKERIIRLDAYILNITFSLKDMPESELYCYAYSGAVSKAVFDNPTLGGVADRAVITGKKYVLPKYSNYGEGWELIITLRITVEGMEK
jgi:hypothetical protein